MTHAAQLSGTGQLDRKPIGGSALRIDSIQKVTGQTRYVEDMDLPGLLHVGVLRCPHVHARLLELDVTAAAGLPGVVRIITAADIPGENSLRGYSQDEPILTPVGGSLRQIGAPIALVAAHTLEEARKAAAAIHAVCEQLPAVLSVQEALEPDATRLYPDGNILNTYQIAHGDLEAAFLAADTILETDYQTSFQEHATLEREAALGYPDEGERITVVAATHEPHWQQAYIAQALGIDPAWVRVIVPPTGGSFGGRQDPWPLVVAGLVTYLLRRPVRLAFSRREVFDATPKRHPYHMHLKIGATATGRLTGIQARIEANTGGYDSAGYWIPNYAVTSIGGAYSWQAVDALACSVYTNGPKCGQFRGYGTPQGAFALECCLDELAQKLSVDPLEFRLNNLLEQAEKSFLGYPVAESLGYREVLEMIKPSYLEFQKDAQAFNARAPHSVYRMGVGLAGMWYRFGKSGSLRIETHAELSQDGNFVIYCSAPDYGQGIGTVMVQLAAETLGVPRGRIRLVNADTALTPDSGIQGASRATYFIGSSIVNAAENLRAEMLAVAAELLDQDPAELRIDNDRVVLTSDPFCYAAFDTLAEEIDRLGKSRKVVGLFDLSPQFPEETRPEYLPLFVTGAQAAQVLVDMETGQVAVKRVAAAHDVGRVINPLDAVGQIQGAIVMGLGTALMEEYQPGLSTGFTDYILPMIQAAPDIEVHLVEVPSYHGPLGAKGLGEAAILPTAPAIINAISRAIDFRLRRLPATPERILAGIRGQVQ
jgi:CO/xanthine dehydrogenase Mo-binding subunit